MIRLLEMKEWILSITLNILPVYYMGNGETFLIETYRQRLQNNRRCEGRKRKQFI